MQFGCHLTEGGSHLCDSTVACLAAGTQAEWHKIDSELRIRIATYQCIARFESQEVPDGNTTFTLSLLGLFQTLGVSIP